MRNAKPGNHLTRIASFSTNRNNAYALALTVAAVLAPTTYYQQEFCRRLEKRPGLIRVYKSNFSKIETEFFGVFQNYCHCITQMRDTLIRGLFTVIYGLVHCSWKQRLNASKVGYKIGFWRNCCHVIMKNENWEWRVSPKYDRPFLFQFLHC